jgi:hypothetical protein
MTQTSILPKSLPRIDHSADGESPESSIGLVLRESEDTFSDTSDDLDDELDDVDEDDESEADAKQVNAGTGRSSG